MRDYIADDWGEVLQANNLNGFDDWWALEADWFEEPNIRRGGWSGVSRISLTDPNGGERVLFLKRQEDHVLRTLLHPLRGILTFVREMKNILALQAAGVPALTPVYFAQRNVDGKQRAVLVTAALDGFVPMDEIDRSGLSRKSRQQLVQTVANVVSRLHAHKLVHNCLYPKHLFVRGGDDGFDVHLIDLEKARPTWCRDRAMFRDLDTLNRYSTGWTRSDRRRFLQSYLGDADARQWRGIWQRLAARAQEKRSRTKKSAQGKAA